MRAVPTSSSASSAAAALAACTRLRLAPAARRPAPLGTLGTCNRASYQSAQIATLRQAVQSGHFLVRR